MKWEIKGRTSFPVLRFDFTEGEVLKSQPGSLLAMSTNIDLSGKADGGILKSIGRMFSGETFFVQHMTSKTNFEWAVLSSPLPGDLLEIELKGGKEILMQKDGFLACTENIEVSAKVQGLVKGVLSGEGLFISRVSGEGTVFLKTYGSIYEIDVKEGSEVLVDNGNLVAWESSLNYEITKAAKSWVSSVTTGSGFVCKFKGKGKVWAQTCNLRNLAGAIFPLLPGNTFNTSEKRE